MAHSSLAAAAGSGRSQEFSRALEAYVETLTSNFSSTTVAQPEDQLKAPVSKLVATAAELLGLDALARTEVQVAEVKGRPDIGVDISKVICGHIELKAPGNGSDPSKFKDKRSRDQFERFRGLPNLIYTDGRDWALYRRGDRVSRPVSLSFDPTDATPDQISSSDADQLFSLLISFLKWEPVVPNTPKALAGLIAPITRYLRDEVLLDVENGGPSRVCSRRNGNRHYFPIAMTPGSRTDTRRRSRIPYFWHDSRVRPDQFPPRTWQPH